MAPKPELDAALGDGLAWLLDRWRSQMPPEEARRCLVGLQAAHPWLDIDLVWEREDCSGTVHYDLLIRPGGEGTVSLSFCPDRAIPWPLRNAFRANDSWIVKVNGRVIEAQTAMAALDVIWGKTDLVQGIVNLALIEEAVTRRGLTVSDVRLQQAMNAFRRSRGLLSKAGTERYLEAHGLTQRDLEFRLEWQLLEGQLREEVTRGKLEEYFAAHQADFETAHVARFRVADEAAARRIAADLSTPGGGFLAAVQERFLKGSHSGPVFAVWRRGSLSAAQTEAIFGAATGEIVVAPAGEGYDVVQVLRTGRASLDDATRSQVQQAVFDAWLAEERQHAQIVWFWGGPDQLENRNAGWTEAGAS